MKKSFMERLAAFIVDKRRLFVVLFAVACVLSIFSASKTDVNNELTDYLPDSTQTRQGLEIMNREFITYGDAKVMVSNVTLAQAEELRRLEVRPLSPDTPYHEIESLRLEAREKLAKIRPLSIGQASRISGVSPADNAASIPASA